MLTVTQVRDGDTMRYTVHGGEETERFSVHLLAEADPSVFTYDRESGVITLAASNGVWRYKVDRFDDEYGMHRDDTVVAHLIEQP